MFRRCSLTHLLSASALSLAACATADDGAKLTQDRDAAIEALQLKAGAQVALETNAAGTSRVLAMAPRFPVAGHLTDPVEAAKSFLAEHHDVFQLSATDASNFVVTRTDADKTTGLNHITLQRTYNDIPVFQGAMTVHMDSGNNV